MPAVPERINIGVFTFETRSVAQHLVTRHIGQVQVKQDDLIVVELAEIDCLFAQISREDVEALGFEHQLNRLRGRLVILNQQYAHASLLSRRSGARYVLWDELIKDTIRAWLTNPLCQEPSF